MSLTRFSGGEVRFSATLYAGPLVCRALELTSVQSEMFTLFLFLFSGSMVPFSLRVLHAELPQYMGRPKDALDNLYELQRKCSRIQKNLQDNLTEDGGQGEMTPENRLGKVNPTSHEIEMFNLELKAGYRKLSIES